MSGIPYENLPPLVGALLPSDGVIICRDGINLLSTTFGALKQAIVNAGFVTLAYSPTLNWDASAASGFITTLTGNTTLELPTNLVAGSWIMYVKQDATGSRVMNFDPAYRFPRGATPVLSTLPNAVDILTITSDGTNLDINIVQNSRAP